MTAIPAGPPPVVVMGVSGSGKTTLGRSLASTLAGTFLDADDLHPPANIAKMSAGLPLDDSDRAPWLDAVGREIAARSIRGTAVVCACSALRRIYRDRLRAAAPDVVFVELTGPRGALEHRVAAREGHFMPASLIGSQLATWEPLAQDERGTTIDLRLAPADQSRTALGWLLDQSSR